MTQFRLFKLKSSDLRIFSLNNQYFHIRVHVHVFKKSRIFEKKKIELSQKIFEAQRCFIPHFNSLEELIWQNFMHVYFKIDISWLKSQTPSLLFHASDNFTKSRFLKKKFCEFLVKSQKLFKLQKCVTSHFNSLEKLIWPYFMHIYFEVNRLWHISQNAILLFYALDFSKFEKPKTRVCSS